tara:strand:- start:1198 stop:1683 length:486 start_codon:yes stop_codon:yes gene_type:complete
MKCTLVRLEQLSGNEATVYSVLLDDEQKNLYQVFLEENLISFRSEVIDINGRLKTIGQLGAREGFFKLKEGVPGDGVCALYDEDESNLRLYCIRYGNDIVILGGGGEKPKEISALQESPKLTTENDTMRKLSKAIQEKIKEREIKFSADRLSFEGELEFEI